MIDGPAINTQNLSKSFGALESLSDCTLTIGQGEVFGLLGPNGAGKSTLIRLLMGMLKPSSGSGHVFGHCIVSDSLAVKGLTAYLPGDARLYKAMRGSQVIELFSALRGAENGHLATSIARRLDLDLKRRVGLMSTGMKQKLAIAITLGAQARLAILDEPTANLDPEIRRETLALVREANAAGATILLSSHLFSDIDGTCTEVAVLRHGKIVTRQRLNNRVTKIVQFTCPQRLPFLGQLRELLVDDVATDGTAPENAPSSNAGHPGAAPAPATTPSGDTSLGILEFSLNANVTGLIRPKGSRHEFAIYCTNKSYRLLAYLADCGARGELDGLTVREVGVEAIYDRVLTQVDNPILDQPDSEIAGVAQ